MAASGDPSSMNGGFPVAISTMVQPSDQMSAGAPYPRWPLSMTSGAMYWRVPVNVSVLKQRPARRFEVPKSDILTTPLVIYNQNHSVSLVLYSIKADLKPLWNCSVNCSVNCSKTALNILENCSETALKNLWNCSVNCSANCSKTALNLQ